LNPPESLVYSCYGGKIITDISEALLTLGYFPRELPSTFTTVDFGQHSSAILSEWRASKLFDTEPSYLKRPGKKRFPLAGSYQYKIQDTEAEYISKPKKAFERRAIHLTHPVPRLSLLRSLVTTGARSPSGSLGKDTQ
jgi:hypothetical protein